MSKRLAALLLPVIILLAAGLRIWRLDDVPPGLWWDEGHHDWAALNIIEGGPRPIYFTEAFGFEPLHIYLTALMFRLFGVHYLAARWVSALAGTLTVPALYWAAVQWTGDLGEPRARVIGLLAAATLAVLFAHVLMSRIGFEVVLVPAGSVLTLAAFGRSLRTQRTCWFALTGVLLGVTLYTYPSARALPLVIITWIGTLLLIERTVLRAVGPRLGLLMLIAAIVYTPLGWFFWRNPEWFLGRMRYVSAGVRSGPSSLFTGLWRTVLGLIVHGETYPRHNLPGRPLLDPIQALLFLIGLGLVLWQARQRSHAKWLLLIPIWLLITMLPSALADGAPSFTRALGAAPPAALLVAISGEHLWRLEHRRWGHLVPTALLILVWLLSTTLAVVDLFIHYPTRSDVFDAYQADQWAALTEAQKASRTGLAYLSPAPGSAFQPTVEFVLRTTPQIRAYDGRVCQVFPRQAEQDTTYTLFVLDDRASLARLQALFPTGQVVREILHRPEPYPFAEILRIPAGAEAQIDATPVRVRFAEAVELIACRVEVISNTLDLTLYWQPLASPTVDYTVFVHLESGDRMVGQLDSQPCAGTYPTTRWQPGEVVMEQRRLPLSAAGAYDLYVGLYNLATMQRLPITAADVLFADDRAHIATVTMP